jgi:ABC-type transport system involved in cytochrome bd biosynthesis fused ATPase/permease subunit
VTHQLQYLQDNLHIVVLNCGQIQIQGSYEHVKNSDGGLNLLRNFNKSAEKDEENENENVKNKNEVSLKV